MQLTAPPFAVTVLVTTTRAATEAVVVTGVPVVPTGVTVAKGKVATCQSTLTKYFAMCKLYENAKVSICNYLKLTVTPPVPRVPDPQVTVNVFGGVDTKANEQVPAAKFVNVIV